VRAARLLYPRGPRSGPGYAVPVHPHLTGPIRPTPRHSPTSPPCGLYALPSLCAQLRRLGDPRVVPCFRWHPFSTCRPPGSREAQRLPIPSSFTADAGLRPKGTVSALPTSPPSDSRGGVYFAASLRFAFAATCQFARPPVGADQALTQPTRTFTSGLSTDWSPAPPPDITTVATGQVPPAGLSPASHAN
jgi:hypothetical protein